MDTAVQKPAHAPLILPLILLSALIGGCAASGASSENDPFEGFNRSMYSFNDTMDRALLKPVAQGYQKVMPEEVSQGVGNFFSNLDDVVVLFNDLLQFKGKQALSDFWRITWNTTVGIGGIFDVASAMDLPKHNEDFGQTLGSWGLGPGPYLVLPFLGPSSLRDGTGTLVDWQVDPVTQVEDDTTRWALIVFKAVHKRAGLLRASRVLDQASLDPYIFLREAYLQQRQNLVYDGNPPLPDFEDFEDFDDLEALDEPAADPLGEPAGEPDAP